MDALDLITLGRRLIKIGADAMRGSSSEGMPMGPRAVLRDVTAHPESSIKDITARTGLPQSYVSEWVAKFREHGVLESRSDPADGRRTLVRVSAGHRQIVAEKGSVLVDAALAQALGASDAEAARIIETVADLARRLQPAEPGQEAKG